MPAPILHTTRQSVDYMKRTVIQLYRYALWCMCPVFNPFRFWCKEVQRIIWSFMCLFGFISLRSSMLFVFVFGSVHVVAVSCILFAKSVSEDRLCPPTNCLCPPFPRSDGGNPVTGQGYQRGADNHNHSTAAPLNGSKQVINKNRIPPGGFSSGLW